MHHYQKSILWLFASGKPIPLKLRFLSRQIGAKNPQTIKYHLQILEKNWLIQLDTKNKIIYLGGPEEEDWSLVSLPKMGQANCWFATAFADNTVEGYLRVSRRLLPTQDTTSLFVLQAKWDSMNNAKVNGISSIEDGDYVIVKETREIPNNNDYVVSIIDWRANIKKFYYQAWEIALISESKDEISPIFIDSTEWSTYRAVWKVIKVIKNPK